MCGFIGNTHQDRTLTLIEIIKDRPDLVDILREVIFAGPASTIDIIIEHNGQPQVSQAVWWLLLEQGDQGQLRPSRYTSFNTRADKLNVSRSAGFQPYRYSRCIIPATYIIEGEGPKQARRYHRIEAVGQQFALGGLYREWRKPDSGDILRSCSVITTPPHPAWRHIHSKSTPLFLPNDLLLQRRWLSHAVTEVSGFAPLLTPSFPSPLRCVPIERPGKPAPVGEPFTLTET